MKMRYRICLLAALALPAYASESARSIYNPVSAADFGTGLIPPTDGVYVREDLWFYDGDLSGSIRNGAVEAEAHLSALGATTRLIWYPGIKLLGARYGTYASFALVDGEASSRIIRRMPGRPEQAVRTQGDRAGFSDISFTPLSLGWSRGNWHVKWSEAVNLPTSDYDTSEVLNLGRNYFALNSSLGLTYRAGTEGPEYNLRAGFIINDENPDTNYRTGNEAFIDGSLAWRFAGGFTAGLTGYAYQQVTGDSGEGAVFGDFEGRSRAVGPVFRYILETPSRRFSFIAKWLHQFDTEYQFEGDLVMLSLATKF